jgi:hypothetical protein
LGTNRRKPSAFSLEESGSLLDQLRLKKLGLVRVKTEKRMLPSKNLSMGRAIRMSMCIWKSLRVLRPRLKEIDRKEEIDLEK